MTLLILVEACAVGVLGLLVCGLLRSHAEILRTLEELAPGHRRPARAGRAARAKTTTGPQPIRLSPPRRGSGAAVGADLEGTTPAAEPVSVTVVGAPHDTLLAFLSSGCHTCSGFWRSLRNPYEVGLPGETELVVVTKSPAEEDLGRIRELANGEVPVVMSTEAWKRYEVPVTPYFTLVDRGSGRVVGQGTGSTWSQVTSLVAQASADDRSHRRRATRARREREDESSVDNQLLAAGLRPGDPSLYQSGRPGQDGRP